MDELHNEILKYFFKNKKEKRVLLLNSFKLNDRLIVQQGTFLVPGSITCSFDENLNKYLTKSEPIIRLKLKLTKKERNNILRELDRMNIKERVLFPGLQGYSESLSTQLAFPERLRFKDLDIFE